MSDVAGKAFKAIEDENIAPKPRWHFALKNFIFWLLLVLSIILGGFCIAVSISILANLDWDVYRYLGESLANFVFVSIPYLWVIVFLMFLLAAYYDFRQTKRGYKYEFYKLFLGGVITMCGLGVLFFLLGLDFGLDEMLSRQVPFYDALIFDKDDIWNNHEKGLLSGKVLQIENPQEFVFQEFDSRVWQVEERILPKADLYLVKTGSEIKLIGDDEGNNIFLAKEIRPWKCCGR